MLNSRKCFKRTTLQTRHSTGNRDEKLKGKVYLVNQLNFEWYQNFESGFHMIPNHINSNLQQNFLIKWLFKYLRSQSRFKKVDPPRFKLVETNHGNQFRRNVT